MQKTKVQQTSYLPSLLLACMLSGLWMTGSSCQKEDTVDDQLVYLQIDTFTLNTDPARQGSASEKITEAWLSLDGQFLGAYSLPARVPVLGIGEHDISLRAGIRDNGIGATPETYPFYRDYAQTLTLQSGQAILMRPSTTYDGSTRFSFIEGFESGRPYFGDIQVGSSVNALQPVGEGSFEGGYSGRITLTKDDPSVQIATLDRYWDLGPEGSPLYLELNYRSDVPVLFGLVGYYDQFPNDAVPIFDPGFLPSETWNKIYFNFTPLLLQAGADEYQVVLQATLPQENGVYTMEEASIWLDNIKLVHF